jgi:hypothetical protein
MTDSIRLLLARRQLELALKRVENDRASHLESVHPQADDAETKRRLAAERFGLEPAPRQKEKPASITLKLDPRTQTILSYQLDEAQREAMNGMPPPENRGRKRD